MGQSSVKGLSKQNGPKLVDDGNSVAAVGVVAVVVSVVEIVGIVVGVVTYNAGGSHNSRNLLQPPGGGDSCPSDGGRKRRDWTNQEFIKLCRILDWLSNLSEEGSQTFSLDVVLVLALSTVLVLSSELKLLFELKEKRVVSEPVKD